MDERVTIKPNEWIISEGGTPAYYIYELVSGRVGVYHKGEKVNEVEVNEGDDSVFLGIIAAMREDRARAASVQTETEVVAIMHSIDQIAGILRNEIPVEVKSDVHTMIEAITLKNEIDVMAARLKSLPKISAEIPSGMRDQARRVVNEVAKIYADQVGSA
jgi:CRP-like cAMP-binding protein